MSYTIQIPKNLYSDLEQFTEYDVLVYAVVQRFGAMRDDGMRTVAISPAAVAYQLVPKKYVTAAFKNKIVAALKHLFDSEMLVGCKISNNLYLIEPPEIGDSYYITMDYEAVRKIFANGFFHRVGLFRYFCIVLDTVSSKIAVNGHYKVVGNMPLLYLAEVSDLDIATVMKYNRELESLQVLYIAHTTTHRCNAYGRYEDKEFVDAYAKEHNLYSDAYETASSNRVTSLRYKRYVDVKGEGYSPEQTEELYYMCLEYNKRMDELQERYPEMDYASRKKDLSVFVVDNRGNFGLQ